MSPLLLVLLAGLVQSDDPASLFDRTRFVIPAVEGDAANRVLESLLNPDHWKGAYREIIRRLGPFPPGLSVTVDFTTEGEELARAGVQGKRAKVSFNLTKLVESQKSLDEVARKRKEIEGRGGKIIYKIPPVRFDRLIYHELTHVMQRNYKAPLWFLEGMAQLIGDDPNSIYAFRASGRKIQEVDEPVVDRNDAYARGHLFWKWLDSRGIAQRIVGLTVYESRGWQEALEDVLQSDWSVIRALERDWSAKELEKIK